MTNVWILHYAGISELNAIIVGCKIAVRYTAVMPQ